MTLEKSNFLTFELESYKDGDDSSSRKTSSVDLESTVALSESDRQEETSLSDHDCDKDSLDGEKEKPVEQPVYDPNLFESVVFKGKMLRRTLSTQSQMHSSLGDLIAGVSDLEVHRPHNQQVHSARPFHHQVCSNNNEFGLRSSKYRCVCFHETGQLYYG